MSAVYRCRGAGLTWLVLMMAGAAHAGIQSPCDDPTVLTGTTVQVFIFPYESERKLTPKGRALATLMQRHVLFAALKYPSIGVAELTESIGSCLYSPVSARVRSRLKPGQTAIFLYGRVFEQGPNIYLKSSVSVATDADLKEIHWPLVSSGQPRITTTTPSEVQGFSPRTIPLSFLERLEPSQQKARRVHKQPSELSSFEDLPGHPDARFTYLVLGTQGDWMRVRVLPFGVEGWVPAHALATGDELKGEFPELYFVDGLVGYFSRTSGAVVPDQLASKTRASFARYLQATESLPESDARALALILTGNTRLLAGGTSFTGAALDAARTDYRRAVTASPTWTPARSHLLAITTLLCSRGACGNEARTLETQYLEAIGRDPLSRELMSSLNAYYDAASLGKVASGLPPDVLEKKRATVREVRARMLAQ
jgi:hypothetical protein